MFPYGVHQNQFHICPQPNRRVDDYLKVVKAVADFFRAIALYCCKAPSRLKDRVIDLFPKSIAEKLDSRRKVLHKIQMLPLNRQGRVIRAASSVIFFEMNQGKLRHFIGGNGVTPRGLLRFIRSDVDDLHNKISSIDDSLSIADNYKHVDTEAQTSNKIDRDVISENLFSCPFIKDRESCKKALAMTKELTDPSEAISVFFALLDISPQQRKIEIEKALFLSKKGMNYVSVIQEITKIPIEERDAVFNHLCSFIQQGITYNNLARVINHINHLVSHKKEAIINSTLSLHSENNPFNFRLLEALMYINDAQRDEVLSIARKAFNDDMSTDLKQRIIEAVANLPSAEREAVMKEAKRLFKRASGYVKALIIQDVGNICATERKDVIDHALTLAKGHDCCFFFSVIKDIKADERSEVINIARKAFTQDMSADLKQGILKAVANLPSAEREAVMKEAQKLCPQSSEYSFFIAEIIPKVAAIKAEERTDVINHACSAIKAGVPFWNVINTIETIADIVNESREDVIKNAITLFNSGMEWGELLIKGVKSISSNEMDEMIKLLVLIMEKTNLDPSNLDNTIKTLKSLSADQRESVIKLTLSFNETAGLSDPSVLFCSLFRRLAEVNFAERGDVAALAKKVFNEEMSLQEKGIIISDIANIPRCNREVVIEKVAQKIASKPLTRFYDIRAAISEYSRQG